MNDGASFKNYYFYLFYILTIVETGSSFSSTTMSVNAMGQERYLKRAYKEPLELT